MALDIENPERVYRPVGFSVVGVVLLLLASYLLYDVMQRKAHTDPLPAAYQYTIDQSVDTKLQYFTSSFFDQGPGANTAYVSELTDTISATFHYNYHASKSTKLTYTYDVKAVLRGNYALQNNTQDISSVWSKEITLVEPVTETLEARDIVINPSVRVPYADYKSRIEQFKTALSLPLSSEATVRLTMKVDGEIDGQAFSDTRVASVTAPLDQSIYTLAVKYDKNDTKQIVSPATVQSRDMFERYELILAIALAVIAIVSLVYGLRRQIFKTPYQRELDRIYRYHDGIIIKAREETDLTDKKVVYVQSFDDMLNLEEELKAPIVASPSGGEATRFMIIRHDVVYIYVLGKEILDDTATFADVETTLLEPDAKPKRHASR